MSPTPLPARDYSFLSIKPTSNYNIIVLFILLWTKNRRSEVAFSRRPYNLFGPHDYTAASHLNNGHKNGQINQRRDQMTSSALRVYSVTVAAAAVDEFPRLCQCSERINVELGRCHRVHLCNSLVGREQYYPLSLYGVRNWIGFVWPQGFFFSRSLFVSPNELNREYRGEQRKKKIFKQRRAVSLTNLSQRSKSH